MRCSWRGWMVTIAIRDGPTSPKGPSHTRPLTSSATGTTLAGFPKNTVFQKKFPGCYDGRRVPPRTRESKQGRPGESAPRLIRLLRLAVSFNPHVRGLRQEQHREAKTAPLSLHIPACPSKVTANGKWGTVDDYGHTSTGMSCRQGTCVF